MSARKAGVSLLSRAAAVCRSGCFSGAGPSFAQIGLPAVAYAAAHVRQPGVQFRSIWTSTPTFSNLANVLKEEIKHEKDSYSKAQAIASGPPAPFVLSEAPDDTMLTLTRTYQGEQIAVDLHANNQPEADYNENADESEVLNVVVFNVSVTKGDNVLVFECESDGTFLGINHVSHESKDGPAAESAYTGPVFEELDEALQREFQVYLEQRGITEELGEYLRHLVFDKEQREYSRWLQKVHDFVGQPAK